MPFYGPLDGSPDASRHLIHSTVQVVARRFGDGHAPMTHGDDDAATLVDSAVIGVYIIQPRNDRHHFARKRSHRSLHTHLDVSTKRIG